jgi:phage gp29-like protein
MKDTFNKAAAIAAMRRSAGQNLASAQTRSIRAASSWREQYNPMRNLNMPNAVRMLEAGATGMYADLQWTYAAPDLGIEAADPDLSIIIERTIAGLSECNWQIKTISDETRGFDTGLAQEQEEALREFYENCKNLKQAWEHLTFARFRGFAHLNPWHRADGTLERLEPLPQYAMVRESGTNNWAFNPDCRQTSYASIHANNRLDKSEYVMMQCPRSVNRIGLAKTIRANTDEKDWDAFVETYGLPGVYVIMPQNIEGDDQEYWINSAEDAAGGGNGVLPYGSDIKTLSDARGMQPFLPRLKWLQEQLVLVGTGGLLNGLAVSGSGTLAGSVHAQAFREIVRRQATMISECMQGSLDIPYLNMRFPDRPVLAYFDIEAAKERDTTGVVQNVSSLATAGYFVDPKQVEEDTGYKIIRFEPQTQQTIMPGMNPQSMMTALRSLAQSDPETFARALRTATAQRSAPEDLPETNKQLVASAKPEAVKALAQDLTPLADEIKALLDKSDQAMTDSPSVQLLPQPREKIRPVCWKSSRSRESIPDRSPCRMARRSPTLSL